MIGDAFSIKMDLVCSLKKSRWVFVSGVEIFIVSCRHAYQYREIFAGVSSVVNVCQSRIVKLRVSIITLPEYYSNKTAK